MNSYLNRMVILARKGCEDLLRLSRVTIGIAQEPQYVPQFYIKKNSRSGYEMSPNKDIKVGVIFQVSLSQSSHKLNLCNVLIMLLRIRFI